MEDSEKVMFSVFLFSLGIFLGVAVNSLLWRSDVVKSSKNNTLLDIRGSYYKIEYVKEVVK